MRQQYDFNDLFVFEMANNHQGDVEHGLRIIREMGAIAREYGLRAGIKFQFRQLSSFIHPDYRDADEPKHIKRFLSTELSRDDFQRLYEAVREQGLVAMCTPFDEASVDVIEQMGFDIIKVASCSCQDWPLLERISEANLPVIVSTAGQNIAAIDNISSFCHHRGVDHAIMHCVALYPTDPADCRLDQIDRLRERYRDTTIGWSTHESPDETDIVIAAYAKGARMYEKHVGVIDGPVTQLNAYSATPEQVRRWVESVNKAKAMCGDEVRLDEHLPAELDALAALQRGVYARHPLAPGDTVFKDDVYFAMPLQPGQMVSGVFKDGTSVSEQVDADQPVLAASADVPDDPSRKVIQSSLHEIKAMLNEARVPLNSDFKVEYSHHYGVENFPQTGAVLIELVNRAYCKKIVVQLPGQHHPAHFHKLKDETFIILYGTLHLEVDGHQKILSPGETAVVQPGVWHHFWTYTGVIFEEISSTHKNDDSFYKDKRINRMARSERKTIVDHWGRFTLGQAQEENDSIWKSRTASDDDAKDEPTSVTETTDA